MVMTITVITTIFIDHGNDMADNGYDPTNNNSKTTARRRNRTYKRIMKTVEFNIELHVPTSYWVQKGTQLHYCSYLKGTTLIENW